MEKIHLPIPDHQRTEWPWQEVEDAIEYDASVNWPKISIIVPSFNQGSFLEETLRSILLQQYPHLELLVVDGGSTDESIEILRRYDPWISRWVSEKDRGQSHALNKGIEWATGEYIGWQNSDDIYYKGALKELAQKVIGGFDVAYSSIKGIDSNSMEITRLYFPPFHPRLLQYYSIVFSNQATLYRSSLLKQLRINESLHYAMDFDLEFRLWKAGARFGFVKGFWGAIRFHAEAKTVNEFYKKVKQEECIVRSSYGIKTNPFTPLYRQYPLQYLWCLIYVAVQRTIHGGIGFRLKKLILNRENLFKG